MTSGKWKIRSEPIYFGGQGITRSKHHWYLSTTHWRLRKGLPMRVWREGYLLKLDYGNYKISAHRKIPFQELGYDHIGDLDFFKGLIYASFENVNTASTAHYSRPRVVLFGEDLKVRGYSDLVGQTHLPWCAVNPRDETVYSSEFDPVTHINVFELKNQDSANLITRLELEKTLHKAQGGAILHDKLYVSCDDAVRGIYEIDMNSGEVETILETKISEEMEGLCLEISDEIVFHFIDHEGQFYHAQKAGLLKAHHEQP